MKMVHRLKNLNKHWYEILTVFLFLVVVSVILGAISDTLNYLQSLRIIFGGVYVLFLPGYILTYVFFPKRRALSARKKGNDEVRLKGEIDLLERVALGFALSIAVVPLAVFYLNLIGVGVSLLSGILTILGIIIISGIFIYYRSKRHP